MTALLATVEYFQIHTYVYAAAALVDMQCCMLSYNVPSPCLCLPHHCHYELPTYATKGHGKSFILTLLTVADAADSFAMQFKGGNVTENKVPIFF